MSNHKIHKLLNEVFPLARPSEQSEEGEGVYQEDESGIANK